MSAARRRVNGMAGLDLGLLRLTIELAAITFCLLLLIASPLALRG